MASKGAASLLRYLLVPGRHLVTTGFQQRYLPRLLATPVTDLPWIHPPAASTASVNTIEDAEKPLWVPHDALPRPDSGVVADGDQHRLTHVVFALTSANQRDSRYNPIPFMVRAIALDRFAQQCLHGAGEAGVGFTMVGSDAAALAHLERTAIVGIPHFHPTPHFARRVLQHIEADSGGELVLTPANTVVCCGTPEVTDMYADLGFGVVGAERDPTMAGRVAPRGERGVYPLEVVETLAAAQGDIRGAVEALAAGPRTNVAPTKHDADATGNPEQARLPVLSRASASVLLDYPAALARLVRIYADPLLTDSGSLTEDRDYATYAYGMSNSEIMDIKVAEVLPWIKGGRVVDEGCADGALLARITQAMPDADLLGIDLSAEFLALCRERQRRGEFRSSFVHFHQRNLLHRMFQDETVDTTICNSTTHELWSYASQAGTVRAYLREKLRQTKPGGRLVIRDVVGPPDRGTMVDLWCRSNDGDADAVGVGVFDAPLVPHCGSPRELRELQAGDGGGGGGGEAMLDVVASAAAAAAESEGTPAASGADRQRVLDALSTANRFRRFAHDFLLEQRLGGRRSPEDGVVFEERGPLKRGVGPGSVFRLPLAAACEFLSKMDYTDNWSSELNEEFAFWGEREWRAELEAAGWGVVEGSHVYTSQWQVDNRWKGRVELLPPFADERTEALPWPPTNMVMVGEKPRRYNA